MVQQSITSVLSTATLSLTELAQLVQGQIKGDPKLLISGVGTIEQAHPGDLTFVERPQYFEHLATTQASAVLMPMADLEISPLPAIGVKNPRLALAKVLRHFYPQPTPKMSIHPSAVISPDASIAEQVSIGAHCVIAAGAKLETGVILGEGCSIGQDCQLGQGTRLHPRVVLYAKVTLGKNCLIHSGAVIGSDGFGFANHGGQWHKVPQVGGVRIGDWVEIGANTCIDRGAINDTVIEQGVILDNLIQIAHNVQLGAHTAIAACVGIAGSTKIGQHCLIGGGTMITGHINIADHVHFLGGSQVANSVSTPGAYASGIPAKPRSVWAKNVVRFHQLNELALRVKKLERQIDANVNFDLQQEPK